MRAGRGGQGGAAGAEARPGRVEIPESGLRCVREVGLELFVFVPFYSVLASQKQAVIEG